MRVEVFAFIVTLGFLIHGSPVAGDNITTSATTSATTEQSGPMENISTTRETDFAVGEFQTITPEAVQKPTTPKCEYKNCMNISLLTDPKYVQVQWEKNGTLVKFIVSAITERDEYVAIGLGETPGKTSMVGADVVVSYVEDDIFFVKDYFINGTRQKCNEEERIGVCPDTIFIGGDDDITDASGSHENGYIVARFTRPIKATDSADLNLDTERNIFAAIGGFEERQLNIHTNKRHTDKEVSFKFNIDSPGTKGDGNKEKDGGKGKSKASTTIQMKFLSMTLAVLILAFPNI